MTLRTTMMVSMTLLFGCVGTVDTTDTPELDEERVPLSEEEVAAEQAAIERDLALPPEELLRRATQLEEGESPILPGVYQDPYWDQVRVELPADLGQSPQMPEPELAPFSAQAGRWPHIGGWISDNAEASWPLVAAGYYWALQLWTSWGAGQRCRPHFLATDLQTWGPGWESAIGAAPLWCNYNSLWNRAIWIDNDMVASVYRPSRYWTSYWGNWLSERQIAITQLCVMITHEMGHHHGLDHNAGGIMNAFVDGIGPPGVCVSFALRMTQ